MEKNEVAVYDKTITDKVQNRVNELVKAGRITLPTNYEVGNAMSSAWLILQNVKDKDKKPALNVCSKESIANALLNMSILGLNPAKQQGYFIVYENQLSWFTSYFGMQAAVSRLKGFQELPSATLIYDGDDVELNHDELGEEYVSKHNTTWANKLKGVITGAYASINFGGKKRTQVMTMADIKEAWSMSKTNREHKQFTGEFAKRTVLNRLLKNILKTSTDDDLVAEKMIETENEHYDFKENGDVVKSVTKEEIETKTGQEEIPVIEEEQQEESTSEVVTDDGEIIEQKNQQNFFEEKTF